MRQQYKDIQFRRKSLGLIQTANAIITGYAQQGLKLTLRQLYYQFVAHHGLPNLEKSYKNLGKLISEARLAGLIDWDAIEDRGRVPEKVADWPSVKDAVNGRLRSFRLPRWDTQPEYTELWVEKQALAGVLWPMASEYHITLMVNKGYSSQTAMYESANRFMDYSDRPCTLLYLGDHDPSGEDMVRDIQDRLTLFGADVEVRKIALTMSQVEEYNPPPNPAKMTDTRAPAYVARHGKSSWEVDALDPATLQGLIRSELEAIVDLDAMAVVQKEENRQRTAVQTFLQDMA